MKSARPCTQLFGVKLKRVGMVFGFLGLPNTLLSGITEVFYRISPASTERPVRVLKAD